MRGVLMIAFLTLILPRWATPSVRAELEVAAPAATSSQRTRLDELAEKFTAALTARDRTALETLVAEPFTWVHASDGRLDTGAAWLEAAGRGTVLSGQRMHRTEHGSTVATYGAPDAHTAIRTARVRLREREHTREIWIRQTQVFVRTTEAEWRVAGGQGTLMYDGPLLDPQTHARAAGVYDLADGRQLILEWQDESLMATLPNGARAQIFLGSPTEEVVRAEAAGRLRFALGPGGIPAKAMLVRFDRVVWEANRRAR